MLKITNLKRNLLLFCYLVIVNSFSVFGFSISDEDGNWKPESDNYFKYEYNTMPIYVKSDIIKNSNLNKTFIIQAFNKMNPSNYLNNLDMKVEYNIVSNIDTFKVNVNNGVYIGYFEDFNQTSGQNIMAMSKYRANKYASFAL